MPSLTITTGPNTGDYYRLGKRTVVIGRDEACPVQLLDDQVSRKHVQIRHESGKYVVMDMKSANGTLINGRSIAGEIELMEDDEITIGSSKALFSMQEFADRQIALAHWKLRGERGKPTLKP